MPSNYIWRWSNFCCCIGTIILWVFWPSFNGLLAEGDARHRCYINTYMSLLGSTVTTFMCSGLLGNRKFDLEDIQNATLGDNLYRIIYTIYLEGKGCKGPPIRPVYLT